jgi:hypothetical protein
MGWIFTEESDLARLADSDLENAETFLQLSPARYTYRQAGMVALHDNVLSLT